MAYAKEVKIAESFDIADSVTIVTANAKVFIPMDELVDRAAELARLNKELMLTQKKLEQNLSKLNNAGFLAKAPQNVVDEVRTETLMLTEKCELLKNSIEEFS